jgi:hypothetical protein
VTLQPMTRVHTRLPHAPITPAVSPSGDVAANRHHPVKGVCVSLTHSGRHGSLAAWPGQSRTPRQANGQVGMITESYFLMRPHFFCVLLVCYSAPRAGAHGRPPVVTSITSAGAVYMSKGMTKSFLMPLLSYGCQAEPGSSPPIGPAQSLTEASEAVGRCQ